MAKEVGKVTEKEFETMFADRFETIKGQACERPAEKKGKMRSLRNP